MPTELKQILAQQLHDIHLPEPVGWWPMAIGWWVLIIIIVCVIGVLLMRLLRSHQQNRYRKYALAELQDVYQIWQRDIAAAHYLQKANAILKRSLKAVGLPASYVSKTGDHWVATLNAYASKPLSDDLAEALAQMCYQPNPEVDIDALHRELQHWLKSHSRPAHV